ncbi:hypothetical protein B0H16DRAFT_1467468 [Mycena metata]|uniref:Uncharacterized protein n=1 Tax=Mycena metata TaxID=1033252 RepID=A0AAD7I426_9AGAR|nr:hypothetical protein B0H16DRAFT_1467468 [Mycena metata]
MHRKQVEEEAHHKQEAEGEAHSKQEEEEEEQGNTKKGKKRKAETQLVPEEVGAEQRTGWKRLMCEEARLAHEQKQAVTVATGKEPRVEMANLGWFQGSSFSSEQLPGYFELQVFIQHPSSRSSGSRTMVEAHGSTQGDALVILNRSRLDLGALQGSTGFDSLPARPLVLRCNPSELKGLKLVSTSFNRFKTRYMSLGGRIYGRLNPGIDKGCADQRRQTVFHMIDTGRQTSAPVPTQPLNAVFVRDV